MKTRTLTALAITIPALASELPPVIPVGPVSYDNVSYQAPSATMPGETATTEYTATAGDVPAYNAEAPLAPAPASSSTPNTIINLNIYSSDYQVRGMGVTNHLSNHGFSSVSGSHTFANRNLFNRGLHHKIGGTFGYIWDGACPLGETPIFQVGYAIGKEIFPNLNLDFGYSFKRGGLEGAAARFYNGGAHRVAQDFNLTLDFNDYQKGFFGHATWGVGFQGLTGSYFDFEAGYRFTNVFLLNNIAADLELSAGVAPSLGYWGAGVEGVDAYRIKAALVPYALNGAFGRDSRLYIKPWVQWSCSGSNDHKIDRISGDGPIDHSQFTIGIDMGWKF